MTYLNLTVVTSLEGGFTAMEVLQIMTFTEEGY